MLPQKRRIKLPHVDAWCPGPVECLRFFARPLAVWNVSIRCKPSADFEDDSDGNRRIRSAPPLPSSDETRIISNILTPLPYILLYWIRLELFETLEFLIFVDIFNLCVVSSIKRRSRVNILFTKIRSVTLSE